LTSDNNLSLILRRLDEIERKLDDVLQELRTPAAIGYSVRRGISSRVRRCAGWAWLQSSKSLAQMNPERGAKRPKSIRLYAMQQQGERAEFYFDPLCQLAPAIKWLGPFRPQYGAAPNNRQCHGVLWPRCIFWTTAEV